MIEELFLLTGKDYKINNFITIKHPILQEIVDLGEQNYYRMIQPFVLSSEDLMVEYDDHGIDYTTVDNYETFTNLIAGYLDSGFDFSWLLNNRFSRNEVFLTNGINGEPVILSKNEDSKGKVIVDRLVYQKISDFLKKINNISITNRYNPGNPITKKFLIMQQREKNERSRKREKEDSELAKIISALAWKDNGKIGILDIWNLHIYQVFNGITTINKIDRSKHLLQGIYSGVIDSKNINSEDLNWIN